MLMLRLSASNYTIAQISSIGRHNNNTTVVAILTYGQNVVHNFSGGTAQTQAEVVKIFQISFVQSVTNNFNVHLVQILLFEASLNIRACKIEKFVSSRSNLGSDRDQIATENSRLAGGNA